VTRYSTSTRSGPSSLRASVIRLEGNEEGDEKRNLPCDKAVRRRPCSSLTSFSSASSCEICSGWRFSGGRLNWSRRIACLARRPGLPRRQAARVGGDEPSPGHQTQSACPAALDRQMAFSVMASRLDRPPAGTTHIHRKLEAVHPKRRANSRTQLPAPLRERKGRARSDFLPDRFFRAAETAARALSTCQS
jgi:hypothetical protein